MNAISSSAVKTAIGTTVAIDHAGRAEQILRAGHELLSFLERGQKIDSTDLCDVMTKAFGGSDAEGFWTWKSLNEAIFQQAAALQLEPSCKNLQAWLVNR